MRRVLAALLSLGVALPAAAEWSPIRDSDWDKLANIYGEYETATARAIAEGPAADVAVLREAMEGARGPEDLAGTWRCRTIKMGDLLPIVSYPNFTCVITEVAPRQWRLEKTTGSQRTIGMIRDDDGFLAYLGVGFVGEAPSVLYPDFPDELDVTEDDSQTYAIIGEVHQMSPNRARILMPDPPFRSDFNLLYLTR